MDLKFGKLENNFEVLEKNYQNNGEITWSQFNSDQKKYKNHVVLLSQNDFKYGTLRIKESCMIKLVENIYFNPNRPTTWINEEGTITNMFSQAKKIDPNRELDWWPDFKQENNKEYFEKDVRNAYRLGFFAAITLENQNGCVAYNDIIITKITCRCLRRRRIRKS